MMAKGLEENGAKIYIIGRRLATLEAAEKQAVSNPSQSQQVFFINLVPETRKHHPHTRRRNKERRPHSNRRSHHRKRRLHQRPHRQRRDHRSQLHRPIERRHAPTVPRSPFQRRHQSLHKRLSCKRHGRALQHLRLPGSSRRREYEGKCASAKSGYLDWQYCGVGSNPS